MQLQEDLKGVLEQGWPFQEVVEWSSVPLLLPALGMCPLILRKGSMTLGKAALWARQQSLEDDSGGNLAVHAPSLWRNASFNPGVGGEGLEAGWGGEQAAQSVQHPAFVLAIRSARSGQGML